jgi:hypothetical protein
MMRLACREVSGWPPLAWLARCTPGQDAIAVYHGRRVEVGPEWFAEAVWDGPCAEAEFDRTDVVFGSGGRLRSERGEATLTFVSPATTVDRLQYLRDAGGAWVSNSLPCLLAAAGGEPDPTYDDYFHFFESIIRGIRRYERELPTSAGPVRLLYFDNLLWDGRELREIEKPFLKRDFTTYEKYREFLDRSLRLLTQNLSAPERRCPYRWLGTMSSGYDSLTTAVLAKPAGLDEAVSFTEARGGGADSGQAAAAVLGVPLTLIPRDAWRRVPLAEVPFIAADAKGEDVFMRGAEAKLEGRALLTGHFGGRAWDRNAKGLSGEITRGDQSGMALLEYRLWAGFQHCPLAFLGVRQIADLAALNRSAEMLPWDVGGRYNRPMARRIIETAGVPRGSFAVHKRAGSVLFFQRDSFLSPESLEDFTGWLRERAGEWRGRGLVAPILEPGRRSLRQTTAAAAAWLVRGASRATGHRIWILEGLGRRLTNIATREPLFRHLFPWAIARAKERYAPGLAAVRAGTPPAASPSSSTRRPH